MTLYASLADARFMDAERRKLGPCMPRDPVGHRRLAAIAWEGMRRAIYKNDDVLFLIPISA